MDQLSDSEKMNLLLAARGADIKNLATGINFENLEFSDFLNMVATVEFTQTNKLYILEDLILHEFPAQKLDLDGLISRLSSTTSFSVERSLVTKSILRLDLSQMSEEQVSQLRAIIKMGSNWHPALLNLVKSVAA